MITGFEPFTTGQGLVLDHNPTADIATAVAERIQHIVSLTLPVSYRKTREALEAGFQLHEPRHWIGLGYAPHRQNLDVETIALNVEHASSGDNDGETPWMRPIEPDAPCAYQTRVNVEGALTILEKMGAPGVPAFHAGTFLCNQTFFLGCHAVESNSGLEKAIFIHVPPMENYYFLIDGLVALFDALEAGSI